MSSSAPSDAILAGLGYGASAVAVVITDPRQSDNPIVDCNAAFEALTGYARSEIVGRNCRFLRGADTDAGDSARLRAAILAVRPALVEILNYRKDGSAFRNAVMIAPIFGPEGELAYFMGSQMEVGSGAPNAAQQDARARVALLSPRQREILGAMAAGRLNKQIAHALGLSERTVKMHRGAVIRALGLRTSAEAIRLAVEAGY